MARGRRNRAKWGQMERHPKKVRYIEYTKRTAPEKFSGGGAVLDYLFTAPVERGGEPLHTGVTGRRRRKKKRGETASDRAESSAGSAYRP